MGVVNQIRRHGMKERQEKKGQSEAEQTRGGAYNSRMERRKHIGAEGIQLSREKHWH